MGQRASVAVKRTILVVEDEKDIRELVHFHLEQEGYAVREADTGESALAQVAVERPALVMLDIRPTTGRQLPARVPSDEKLQGPLCDEMMKFMPSRPQVARQQA